MSEMVNFTHFDDDCPGLEGVEIEEQNGKMTDFFGQKSQAHPQPWCGQHLTSNDTVTKNFYNYTNQENKEKTPMCRIAELSRYHKFKYNYKLMDESGPAHKKLFTVSLILHPDHASQTCYEGSGLSIKKAQQAAAAEALKNLKLADPPDRLPKRKNLELSMTTPVQLLSQVARRLQLPEPKYISATLKPQPLMAKAIPPPAFIQPNGLPGYISPVHEAFFIPKPFEVTLILLPGRNIVGTGLNFSIARDNAAAEALVLLAPSIEALDRKLEMDKKQRVATPNEAIQIRSLPPEIPVESPDMSVCTSPDLEQKHRQKSVISYIHECALQMKLNVQFEVLVEDGPPHDRNYVVQCSLLDANNEIVIQQNGEGRKKKEATQVACLSVLNTLKTLECAPAIFASASLKKLLRRTSLQGKENKRKSIVKDMKMDPSYGHQINPVSRLIQVLQARGEPEPLFNLIGEHGLNRYKEFVIEVVCGDRYCTGAGPNKRLAKRAAAEAMLAEIGFVKPLPAPGKSLLKKKNDPMLNIGVFELTEVDSEPKESTPPPEPSNSTPSWDLSVDASSSVNDSPNSSGHVSPNDGDVPPSPIGKRRVTFNSQVKACPPPEDANYPQPELAPLKADVVVEGKLKRLRKAKEGKRSLSQEQINEVVESAKIFLNNINNKMYEGQLHISRIRLEEYSERYKFSVQFTNFPKSPDGNDQNYFALVSLGLEKPLVCHGSGLTVDLAADNAAFNAIVSLSRLNDPPMSPIPQ